MQSGLHNCTSCNGKRQSKGKLVTLAFLFFFPIQAGLFSCSEACEQVDDEAQAAVAEYQKCEAGSACKVVSYVDLVGKSCVPAFQCYGAFPENADLNKLVETAKRLNEVQQKCSKCVEALCLEIDQYQATCNPQTHRCELMQKTTS